jgi:hypothetical protein
MEAMKYPVNRIAAVALASLVLAGAGAPGPARASSHREAPGIMNMPAGDNTDVYFFVSPTNPNAVTVVGCWWPAEEAAGGPNYYHFGDNLDYAFYVDNDGDAREDVTYTFRFATQVLNPATFLYATGPITGLDDPDWNFRQTYKVMRKREGEAPAVLADGLLVPPVNIGPQSTPSYGSLAAGAVYTINDQGSELKVFAGQRDDPFFVDLGAIFDLLAFRAIPGNVGQGVDGLGGYNCQAIVFEVPISDLTRDGSNPTDPASPASVLGLWSATWLRVGNTPQPSSMPIQVSRLGMPLVNEVVLPLAQKDVWNSSQPENDGQFLNYVLDPELSRLIEGIYGIPAPPTPRCDLVAIFLTGVPGLNQPPDVVPGEMVRLNVAIKPDGNPDSRFGLLGGDLDGFPNGRRLADDVVDIAERAVEGVVYPLLCGADYEPHPLAGQLGDGIDANDLPFLTNFPYLATPWQGWEHDHHRIEGAHDPERTVPVSIGIGGAAPGTPTQAPKEKAGTSSTGARFELGRSFPNPVRAGAEFHYQIARVSAVSLKVYDVNGRAVRTLAEGTLPAGQHTAQWDGTDEAGNPVAAGVYLYRLETPGEVADHKLTVVR